MPSLFDTTRKKYCALMDFFSEKNVWHMYVQMFQKWCLKSEIVVTNDINSTIKIILLIKKMSNFWHNCPIKKKEVFLKMSETHEYCI